MITVAYNKTQFHIVLSLDLCSYCTQFYATLYRKLTCTTVNVDVQQTSFECGHGLLMLEITVPGGLKGEYDITVFCFETEKQIFSETVRFLNPEC